ncbi:hypothetical protein [Brevibacterium jeotgali]|uniref:Uncharacterized protein n=1 Tax=Brevibacterium jeotgali TaxID=1262550 RepID=A0A2H1L4Z4_9MICO|nr:hypothetical protein [Brevibacterium jeotgali]TWB98594.1 hypothetical protein FB108_2485 [Brevibacterium jeotgali]SMY11805.1 hypothetical protein BJEO58_01396 [Brevibacterium jeotgali]
MAKKKRDRRGDDRIESLADLTPERVKGSRRRGPERAKPVSAEERAAWEERVAEAEAAKAGRRTFAPLIVAGVAAAAVLALIGWSALSSDDPPTAGSLPTPVIAAVGGGAAIYPANSAEAVRENVRFGFIPAVDLVELGDGTVALGAGGQEAGEDVHGASYADLTADEFSDGTIPAPREETSTGSPATWAEVYEDFGSDTVFMPSVDSDAVLDAVLTSAQDAERIDAVIVRTADAALAERTADAGAVALFEGDPDGTSPTDLAAAGFGMVAVRADAERVDEWLGSDVGVWLTGVESAQQLTESADAGALGALTDDPFALQSAEDEDGAEG